MKYIKNRSNFSKPKPSKKPRVVLFVGIILVVVVFVFIFSGGDDEVAQDLVVQDENVAEEVEDEVAREVEIVDAALWTQEVVLVDVEGASGSGIARRGVSGDLFTHVVVATLPAIETEFYFMKDGW